MAVISERMPRIPGPLSLFLPYGVKYLNHWKEDISMESMNYVYIQLLDRPKRKAIIKRGQKATDSFPIVRRSDVRFGAY